MNSSLQCNDTHLWCVKRMKIYSLLELQLAILQMGYPFCTINKLYHGDTQNKQKKKKPITHQKQLVTKVQRWNNFICVCSERWNMCFVMAQRVSIRMKSCIKKNCRPNSIIWYKNEKLLSKYVESCFFAYVTNMFVILAPIYCIYFIHSCFSMNDVLDELNLNQNVGFYLKTLTIKTCITFV